MILMDGVDYTSAFISAFWLCFAGYLICYFLMSFALFTMAKKRGLKKTYVSFIPFARYLIAGKLIGNVITFGKKTDKIGLFALLITAIYTFCTVYTTVYNYYFIVEALIKKLPILITDTSVYVNGSPLSSLQEAYVPKFFTIVANVLDYISALASFVWIYVMYVFWNGFFIKYKPGRSTMYTIVALFISFSTMSTFFFPIEVGGIFLFIFRNREPIKINIVYGNPYVNPYGNPYNQNPYGNPYNQNPYNQNQQNTYRDPYGRDDYEDRNSSQNPKPEDPFSEFDVDKKEKQDDFFN